MRGDASSILEDVGAMWEPIETIPDEMKDGRLVYVKRMSPSNPRSIVKEGLAVFDFPHPAAPMRQSMGIDPLGRLSEADYAAEDQARQEMISNRMWLNSDRMYRFPTPTHWHPEKTAAHTPEER